MGNFESEEGQDFFLLYTKGQGRNHVLNIGGGTNFCTLIDARTHIITRTQRLVNTTPRLLL